jgi:hypothetical protein
LGKNIRQIPRNPQKPFKFPHAGADISRYQFTSGLPLHVWWAAGKGKAMRARLYFWVVGLGLLSQGCGPLFNTARTIVGEQVQYCVDMNDISDCVRFRQMAESAWKLEKESNPECHASADYADGFIKGYSDYLYAGGTGNPPPLPPRCYWKTKYENPEGHQKVQDWFAGFRHGVAEAKRSGYRQFVVMPTNSRSINVPQVEYRNPSSPETTGASGNPGKPLPDGGVSGPGGMPADVVPQAPPPTPADTDLPPPRPAPANEPPAAKPAPAEPGAKLVPPVGSSPQIPAPVPDAHFPGSKEDDAMALDNQDDVRLAPPDMAVDK